MLGTRFSTTPNRNRWPRGPLCLWSCIIRHRPSRPPPKAAPPAKFRTCKLHATQEKPNALSFQIRQTDFSDTAPLLRKRKRKNTITKLTEFIDMAGHQMPPNPPPLASRLPDGVLDLIVKPPGAALSDHDRESLRGFQRAACYIAAGIYSPCPLSLMAVKISRTNTHPHCKP